MGTKARSTILSLILLSCVAAIAPPSAQAQLERAAIGAGIGVAGGAVVTVSAIVFRARFQREYLESFEDLIHWQTLPMIGAPAAGIVFGLAGENALVGSIMGSTTGMLAGAAVGTGIGWLVSPLPEAPWAGAVIGAGVGLTLGGLYFGVRGWNREEEPGIEIPGFLRFGLNVPAR